MTLAEYLAEYAAGVVQEWMRIVDIDDPDLEYQQLRASWREDSTFTLGESRYSAEHGRFRLIVKVEEIDPLPPIGPEDDGALRAELAESNARHCGECIQGDEDPRAWCDCAYDDVHCCKGPCRKRAHLPEHCSTLILGEPVEYVLSSFLFIEPGDDIRIPGSTDTADVISVARGLWHANVRSRLMPSGKWWDEITSWDHFEVRASLAVNGGEPTGLIQYPSNTAVEILCTPERKAQLILAAAFIGTSKIGEQSRTP